MGQQEEKKEKIKNRTWSQAKNESGTESLPLALRNMFMRRYNSVIKRKEDTNAAKRSAMSFVNTRFKKVKGKWVDRKNGNVV